MIKYLIAARHGAYDQATGKLTERGEQQAKLLGNAIKLQILNELVENCILCSSPERRAITTMEIVALTIDGFDPGVQTPTCLGLHGDSFDTAGFIWAKAAQHKRKNGCIPSIIIVTHERLAGEAAMYYAYLRQHNDPTTLSACLSYGQAVCYHPESDALSFLMP